MSVNEKMTAIANAIRSKTGGTENLTLDAMAEAIAGIETGSGGDYTNEQIGTLIDRSVMWFIIPDGVAKIGAYAFSGCSSLQGVGIPEGVTSIDTYAFNGCSSLQTVAIPEGVTTIGAYAFSGCSSLQTAVIPEGVTSIGNNAFTGCKKIIMTELPDSITSLSGFNSVSGLMVTKFPANLQRIENYALVSTGISVTEIPAGVTYVGAGCMQTCSNLTELTFLGTPTSIAATVFTGCKNLAVINVPWAEGEVANAPWGATNATINYNYTVQ